VAAGSTLVPYGVRYVVVQPGTDVDDARTAPTAALTRSLDGVPGLRRQAASSDDGVGVWRVLGVTGRARLVPEQGPAVAVPSDDDQVGIDVPLPEGWSGGRLQLADAADEGWRATLDGRALRRVTVDGWAQAFEVPAGSGRLVVEHDAPSRGRWVALQVVLVLVVVVLALPSRRREGEGEDA
jgi:hypothetical protein